MKNLLFLALLFFSANLMSQNWQNHFDEAVKKAAAEHKNIILVFSGSDWCAPCIKLDKNIWQSDVFMNYSKEHWILYKADFPRKKSNKLSEKLEQKNTELAEKYNKNGMFPLVLLLDYEGHILGVTGFQNVTPQEYIEIIKGFES